MSTSAESPRTSVLHPDEAPSPAVGASRQAPFDPLRLCIYTTIAVLAWLLTPPLVVLWMATLGLFGYVKAYRDGLTRSKCLLRDVRLVLLYLSLVWAAGAYFTVASIIHWMD